MGFSWTTIPPRAWHTTTDLARLAETGTTVAHCPTVFARRGITLKDFGRYRRAGVNMGVGTDTYPHNMLDELRLASYLARTQAGNPRTMNSTDLFKAATIGGAKRAGARRYRPSGARLPCRPGAGGHDPSDDAAGA